MTKRFPITEVRKDVQSEEVSAARENAERVRSQWREKIAQREVSVLEAVTHSSDERKYLMKITLLSILTTIEGWDSHNARNALLESGFPLNARLSHLAVSRQRIAEFEEILDTSFQRWVPNITVPDGYPFFGKIEDVLAQVDVSEFMPAESDADEEAYRDDDVEELDDADDDTILGELDDLLGGLD